MYEAAKTRFLSLIEKESARDGAESPAAFDTIFIKLDASVENLISGKGLAEAQAGALRTALRDAKAEHLRRGGPAEKIRKGPPELVERREPPVMERPMATPRTRSVGRWVGGGLAAAGLVGAVIMMPGMASALQPNAAKPDAQLAVFQARLDRSTKSVEELTGYLTQIRTAVEQRQKADPVAFATLAGDGWVSLKTVDPDLFAKRPKGLSREAELKLRAAGDGYKVLLRSALCTDAKYRKPAFVDPRRNLKSAGCEYLAVWNKAGAKL